MILNGNSNYNKESELTDKRNKNNCNSFTKLQKAANHDTLKNNRRKTTCFTSSQESQQAPVTNSSTAANPSPSSIKILKSFYKKDAIASVAKSFLTIDECYYNNKSNENDNNNNNSTLLRNTFKGLSKLSIGADTTNTTENSDNNSDISFASSSCSNYAQTNTINNKSIAAISNFK
jgi:hypothetical protein